MIRDLKNRIYDNIRNYKKPETVEHLNKKAAPKKQLTLSEKKLQKAIAILLRK